MKTNGTMGISGLDWLWLALAVVVDLATIGAAGAANRNQIPQGYQGALPPEPPPAPPATPPAAPKPDVTQRVKRYSKYRLPAVCSDGLLRRRSSRSTTSSHPPDARHEVISCL